MIYQEGQKIKVEGMNMQCRPVIVDAVFVRYLPKNEIKEFACHDGAIMRQDCVIRSEGCNTISDSQEIL